MPASRVYDHSLLPYGKGQQEVSLSIMTLLYQEMIQRLYKQSDSIEHFQSKLSDVGYKIGVNVLELLNYRASVPVNILNKAKDVGNSMSNSNAVTANNSGSTAFTIASSGSTVSNSFDEEFNTLGKDISRMKRRDLQIIDTLQFIHGTVWSYLFGHVSSDLVKAQGNDTEYRIVDNEPQWTQFISGERNQLHYESCNYMLCGVIEGFLNESGFPSEVSAHWQPTDTQPQRVVFLIQFHPQVVAREQLRYSRA